MITNPIKIEKISDVIKLLKNVHPKGVTISIEVSETVSRNDMVPRFHSAAGGWSDLLDGEAFIEDVYKSRKINARPEVKL